jgi:hypothetical protein
MKIFDILSNVSWVTPMIIAIISLFGVICTLVIQNKNFKRQIKSNHSIKMSEMRQNWIIDLRNEMCAFQSYGITPNVQQVSIREFYQHGTKIELLMNPEDKKYKELQELMYEFLRAEDVSEKYSVNARYVALCQEILKAEWDFLKKEMKEFHG